MSNRDRFRANAGVVTCQNCGNRTRDTGAGEGSLEMCAACIEASGVENQHQDGYHDSAADPRCPLCKVGVAR